MRNIVDFDDTVNCGPITLGEFLQEKKDEENWQRLFGRSLPSNRDNVRMDIGIIDSNFVP